MRLGLGILGLRQTRVRARARLRVLRWHGRPSAEVNENINLGYSQRVDASIEWQFGVHEYINELLKPFLKLGKARLP